MKRFCGTLLCLVMLLCVLTATAYGAGAIDNVFLNLDGYEFGEAAADVSVTKNTTATPFTVAEVKLCDAEVTGENIKNPTACDEGEKIKACKDYWLVIKLTADTGYTFGGLEVGHLYIYDYGEAYLLTLEDSNTTAYAAFKLSQLQARFASIKYYRVGEKITDTDLSITPSWVKDDVSVAFSKSPITGNDWNANVISDSAAVFASDTNYYLRLTFKSNEHLTTANEVRVKCWGLRNELTATKLYHNEATGLYCAEFTLPKLTGQLDFTLGNYETGKNISDMTLSVGGDAAGVDFTGTYKADYFIADSMIELFNYKDSDYIKYATEDTTVKAQKYYYLLVGLKAKNGYDIGYLANESVLSLTAGGATFMDDPNKTSTERWNNEMGEEYTFVVFKLPMMGAERVTRVDATVTVPVLGEPVDQMPAILVTTDQKAYRFVGLDDHALGDLEIKAEWRKIAVEDYSEDTEYYDWDEVEAGERFMAGYYYKLFVSAGENYTGGSRVGTYELSPAVIGTINNGGEYEFFRANYVEDDYLKVTRVFTPLEVPQVDHEPIHRQNAAANTTDTTVPDATSKGNTVTSANTFDAGIALYAALGAMSLTGGAWLTGKKRS